MAAQAKPESTDVAVREARESVGVLPPELQHALALRKMRNQVAGQLASQNWGKSLDLETRRAIADWGQQFRVDVNTEIHVLGGNVYLNAAFYLRQLSELIAAGLVEYAYADHVEDDPRLTQLGAEGEGEYSRRLRERIKNGVPDKAASAVVFRVKLRSMDREVTGCKWAGGGTRKNDPVGDDKPVETSESRAARRCMRLLASHVPQAVAGDVERIETSASILSERVSQARTAHAIREASLRRAPQLMAGSQAGDPYATNHDPQTVEHGRPDAKRITVERTPEEREAIRATVASVANVQDPFAENVPVSDEAADRLAVALAFPMPFGQGESRKGTPLGDVATKDLNDAIKFAADVEKYREFSEHAITVVESRGDGE